MRFKKTVLTSLVALMVALATAFGAAASDGNGGDKGHVAAGDAEILAALQRDLGLSLEQAKKHGERQAKAIELDRALQASLGEAFAGSYFDADSGNLVVNVSDAAELEKAKAAGADARLVKHSKAELEAIRNELDVAAGKAKASSAADRKANGKRQASVAGLTAWYVDPKSNTVHVTVARGEAKAAARALAKYGDAVSIEETDHAPAPAADFMDGGDLINGSSCSAGFNLRNPSTGQGYLLTAGHCVTAGSTLSGQGGVAFGPVLESWFPSFDDAIARNDSSGFWIQGPWVDTNPSNGGFINVSGSTDAPVGTTICKSGITTKWTCGSITAKDETVTYPTGTVFGLTRHSACVEKGDSGGANVSVAVTWTFSWPWFYPTYSYSAEGVTSGASLMSDGTRLRCLSVFGFTNVSWYFPIADSLAYYGAVYGVNVW
jgi:streptogrisin C